MSWLQRLLWRPSQPPLHFEGLQPLVELWREADAELRPARRSRHALELYVLLLYELRTSAPDQWPADRVRLVADLMRDVRA